MKSCEVSPSRRPRRSRVASRGVLPALAGIAIGCLAPQGWREEMLNGNQTKVGSGQAASPARAGSALQEGHRRSPAIDEALPAGASDDLIRLAAMAGNTGPAKARLRELMAEPGGFDRPEFLLLLASVVVWEPGYLDQSLEHMPLPPGETNVAWWHGSSAARVLREAGNVRQGATWEILRKSPLLVNYYRSCQHFSDMHDDVGQSGSAFDHLLEPGLALDSWEIDSYYQRSIDSGEDRIRILEEWQAGRWRRGDGRDDGVPDCVTLAWRGLRKEDPAILASTMEKAPPELSETLNRLESQFTAHELVFESFGEEEANPSSTLTEDSMAEALKTADPGELTGLVRAGIVSGTPIPLSILASLPVADLSSILFFDISTIATYLPKELPSAVDQVIALDASNPHRDELLMWAAYQEIHEQRDIETAMKWVENISDEGMRAAQMEFVFTSYAGGGHEQEARDYAARLEAGPLRARLLQSLSDP